MRFEDYIARLRTRLSRPLPGLAAQELMAPRERVTPKYRTAPADARYGAVLILLVEGPAPEPAPQTAVGPAPGAAPQAAVELPLIVRADDGTTHGGQIGLPGGGVEHGDSFPGDTALREAQEEIAAVPAQVEVLGELTPLYIWVSNYLITPVVGAYRGDPAGFEANPAEVEEVVRVRLEDLRNGRTRRHVEARGIPRHVPAYVAGDIEAWGATAMVLSEFFAVHEEVVG